MVEKSNKALCPWCGQVQQVIWVHGHGQCAHCGINTAPCCEGGVCPDKVSA